MVLYVVIIPLPIIRSLFKLVTDIYRVAHRLIRCIIISYKVAFMMLFHHIIIYIPCSKTFLHNSSTLTFGRQNGKIQQFIAIVFSYVDCDVNLNLGSYLCLRNWIDIVHSMSYNGHSIKSPFPGLKSCWIIYNSSEIDHILAQAGTARSNRPWAQFKYTSDETKISRNSLQKKYKMHLIFFWSIETNSIFRKNK